MRAVADLVSLTKPRISAMVAATAVGGLALASEPIAPGAAVLTLLGTAGAAGAANALNCWMERDRDGLMERTRQRALPAGRLRPAVALVFGLALGLASVGLLAAAANFVTAALGLAAITIYVLAYTPLKPRSPVALLVGAVPGALPPLMGSAAATGRVDQAGVVLAALLFLWQIPHFVAIGLLRREDYARAGFRTLPVVMGARTAVWVAVVGAAGVVPASLLLAPAAGLGAAYRVVAILLGTVFLAAAVGCLRGDGEVPGPPRRLLLASLAYLPLLLGALAVARP